MRNCQRRLDRKVAAHGGEISLGISDRFRYDSIMDDDREFSSSIPSSPSRQSKLLVDLVITAFTERLRVAAEKRGGHLTLGDLDQLGRDFESKRNQLEHIFEKSFRQYVGARELAAFGYSRHFPFDRLMVNTFDDLFDENCLTDDGERAATRLILPGFFIAIEKMLGVDTIEEFQNLGRKILHRLSAGAEPKFDWPVLYQDAAAQQLCLDALIAFLPYFEDIDKRRDWFVALINNELDPTDEWELSEAGFDILVTEMFSGLRAELEDKKSRRALEDRIGSVTCYALSQIFEKIDIAGEANSKKNTS